MTSSRTRPAPRQKSALASPAVVGDRLTVSAVTADSEADEAGLEAGDVLLEVDGKAATREVLEEALAGTRSIRLKVERDGEPVDLVAFEAR